NNINALSKGGYSNIQNIANVTRDGSGMPFNASSQNPKQMLKGEIVDLKNNDIVIRLDDGTKISAKIYDSSSLNIGQTIRFQLSDTANGPVIDNYEAVKFTQNSMIFKALEEANLPSNDKNIEIVSQLLKHNMSLDKNTIMNIQRQSLSNKNISVETLVLMNKHNIPVNSTNAQQFDKYCNYEHRIVKELDSIAASVPETFDEIVKQGKPEELLNFNQKLVNIISEIDAKVHQNNNPLVSTAYMYPDAAKEVAAILEPYDIEPALMENIKKGTAPLKDVANAILKSREIADELDDYRVSGYKPESSSIPLRQGMLNPNRNNTVNNPQSSNNFKNNISNFSNNNINNNYNYDTAKGHLMFHKDAFENPTITTILDNYQTMQRNNAELSSFMNTFNKGQIVSKLADIPGFEQITKNIWDGSISANDILNDIAKLLPNATPEQVSKLLTSEEYKSIVSEALINNWTISPEDLKNDKSIEKTYKKMYKQLNEINDVIKEKLPDNDISGNLSRQFKGTRDNIDFMNTINDMLTYVQIPLKMRNQNVHSDLYVMTSKKNLLRDKNNISVLLHLDMQFLGPMDINLNLNNNNINATFNVTDDYTLELIEKNMEVLEYALMEKGFLLNSRVVKKEKTTELIDNFMDKDNASSSLKRYSFDIRT
ncbi:MAG: flagellar hook-length control protein FliK, partial [Lachnospiraceae bacterium]|nr:flagellar hook-length control protein FliK [Lachnospiraceae bacterium]